MRRREYLRGLAAFGAAGVSGCLGATGTGADTNPNVVLSEPDRRFESADVSYPAWGERVPDASVPAPLEGTTASLRSVDEPALVTFFYSYCQTTCPVIVSALRNVQAHALNNGYGDEVEFLPISFDPERDTPERLDEYAEKMNVDTNAGNWHFLRPESKDRAEQVVTDGFGVVFRKTHPEDMDRYMFTHTSLTLLVNADGYVERAYNTQSPDAQRIIADLRRVRET